MNQAMEVLTHRRSIRKYKSTPVPDALLQEVLFAGTCAPSGKDLQSSIIVAVRNKETLQFLSEMNAAILKKPVDPFYGAPAALIVLSASDSVHLVENGSLVMGNLMNAAYAAGLGSCWIHRAREMFETARGKELLKQWGVQGEYTGVGICILGYPDETPKRGPRKDNYLYFVD